MGWSQELILYYQISTYLTYDEVHIYAYNKSGRDLDLASIKFAVLFDSLQNNNPSIASDMVEANFAPQSRIQRQLKAEPYAYLDESVTPPVLRRNYRVNEASLNYLMIYESQQALEGRPFAIPDNGALLNVMTIRFEKRTSGLEPDFFLGTLEAYPETSLKSSSGQALGYEVSLMTSVTYPVEWLSFEGKQTGAEQVSLTWATAREDNNAGFQVERSLDGMLFSPIGFVKGQGASSSRQEYRFHDSKAKGRTYFYRLRQQDINGNYTYSKTEMVRLESRKRVEVDIFPNPSTQQANFKLYMGDGERYSYKILDNKGCLVKEGMIDAPDLVLDVRGYQPGIYRISFQKSGIFTPVSKSFVVK